MAKNLDKLIKEMKNSGSCKLDLSNMGLKEFPKKLCELAELEYLDLSNNQIATLPLEVMNMEGLKYLDLRANAMKFIPDSMYYIPLLETVCLDKTLESIAVNEAFKNQKVIYGYPKFEIKDFKII